MFDENKTAQMAAYFLHRSGGRTEYLRVIKLLYLSEREHLARFHMPMSGDALASLPNGPIVSYTYDTIKGSRPGGYGWKSWIEDRTGYYISLKRENIDLENDLDELSEADLEVLDSVWSKVGHLDWRQLIDYTHDPRNCPEWKNPEGSSSPIMYADVLRAYNFAEDRVDSILASIQEAYSEPSAATN